MFEFSQSMKNNDISILNYLDEGHEHMEELINKCCDIIEGNSLSWDQTKLIYRVINIELLLRFNT